MNRRGFLQSFATVPVAMALSPALIEELLPTRTIFLPPVGGWLADTREINDIIRRAFVAKMITQIRDTSPLLSHLIRRAA